MRFSSGDHLDRFEILALLGEGGMGAVYRARDPRLERDVAVKIIRESLASDSSRSERFQQEAKAASALNHPNIVTIHEIDEFEGTLYLVMELIEGRTLRELVAQAPVGSAKLIDLSIQIVSGLVKAHEKGIVHRDLKPDNLMVTEEGLAKILDFGLAKLVGGEIGEPGSEQPTRDQPMTRSGAVVGTVGTMSPEQIAGRRIDARSDQFALGLILDEAEALMEEALSEHERLGQSFYSSGLFRVKGEISRRRGRESEAETWISKALEVAEEQGALTLALAAASSLASQDILRRIVERLPDDHESPLARRARAELEPEVE